MTVNEKKLVSKLLDLASTIFASHSCNDLHDSYFEEWTIEERRRFIKEYHEYNGDPEEYDENFLHLPDFAIMKFLADKLIDVKEERKEKLYKINEL